LVLAALDHDGRLRSNVATDVRSANPPFGLGAARRPNCIDDVFLIDHGYKKSALMKQLRYKAVEQNTLSSP
jgi:hypothetical protein